MPLRTSLLVTAAVLSIVLLDAVPSTAPALARTVTRTVTRPATRTATRTATGPVVAVGAENEYADVISQIGGPYVRVSAIMSNPNTDPHEFEASASVAETVSMAELIVQNGVGYDSFMDKIESASPRPGRDVIVAQLLLGLSSNIFNPHLWYDPRTMPLVAQAVAADLSKLQPVHAAYFHAQDTAFVKSLQPWSTAIAKFKKRFSGTPVAVTEPVADYMLQAAGADIKTPPSLQAAIMNGTDPSPQDIAAEESLIERAQGQGVRLQPAGH